MTTITRFDSPLTHDTTAEFERQIEAVLKNFGLELNLISFDYINDEIAMTASAPRSDALKEHDKPDRREWVEAGPYGRNS